MTIMVTGASGFLGAWTVRALAAAGEPVIALVRSAAPWRLEGVTGITEVVSPPEEWVDEILRARPETVMAFDWQGVAGALRDDEAQRSNVDRFRLLVAAATEADCRRFVGVGSQAEYGPTAGIITESSPTRPVTEYGRAKLEALSVLRDQSGIEGVWARVFSVYGPLDNEGMVLQKVADATRLGTGIELSSGEQLWSYLYAADAGIAMAMLAREAVVESIVNVAHPSAPRLRDTLTTFAGLLDGATSLRFAPAAGRTTPVIGLEPDVTRLSALGWYPDTTLDEGLATTAAWLSGGTVADPFTGEELPKRPVTTLS